MSERLKRMSRTSTLQNVTVSIMKISNGATKLGKLKASRNTIAEIIDNGSIAGLRYCLTTCTFIPQN
jgi:hypothetical protein